MSGIDNEPGTSMATTCTNLYEQMTDSGKEALALLLGFGVGLGQASATGFCLNLKEIAPIKGAYTLGKAKRAYLKHLLKKSQFPPSPDEPNERIE